MYRPKCSTFLDSCPKNCKNFSDSSQQCCHTDQIFWLYLRRMNASWATVTLYTTPAQQPFLNPQVIPLVLKWTCNKQSWDWAKTYKPKPIPTHTDIFWNKRSGGKCLIAWSRFEHWWGHADSRQSCRSCSTKQVASEPDSVYTTAPLPPPPQRTFWFLWGLPGP